MPNTDLRRIREDYWYTSAQITDVGTAWQQASPDRLFLYSDREVANRTALEIDNVPLLDELPKKILLPLNIGNNHWTAITIDIKESANHRIDINIWYTDSLNGNTNFSNHSSAVRSEIARIENIFRELYGTSQLAMRSAVYPHTWTQPDRCSCGPYSLANGARSLDNRGPEANPGRKRLREQQLDMMTHGTAINSCSISNAADEILIDWIIARAQNDDSLSVTTAEEVFNICVVYADTHHRELADILQIFNEYNSSSAAPQFLPNQVNVRVREIIGELGMQSTHFNDRTVKSSSFSTAYGEDDYSDLSIEELLPRLNKPVIRAAELIAQENISQKIDRIREILSEILKKDTITLRLMHQITLFMSRGHQTEAENLIKDNLQGEHHKDNLDVCLRLISDIIGMRKFSPDNDEKFIYLASAYNSLADAIEQVQMIDLESPKESLEAHHTLLKGAIDRNNASILRQICFAIKDFASSLLEWISGGMWQSEIKRIELLRERFKDNQGNINVDQLQKEQSAIQVILTAKSSIENEVIKHNDPNSGLLLPNQ